MNVLYMSVYFSLCVLREREKAREGILPWNSADQKVWDSMPCGPGSGSSGGEIKGHY